jgi:hypothetical protein
MQPSPNLVSGVRSPRQPLWPKNWLSRYAASRQLNRGGLMDVNGVMRGICIPTHSTRMPALKMTPVVFGEPRSSTDRLSLIDGGHHACYSRCYPLQRPVLPGQSRYKQRAIGHHDECLSGRRANGYCRVALPMVRTTTGSCKVISASWADTLPRTGHDVRAALGSEGRAWSRGDRTAATFKRCSCAHNATNKTEFSGAVALLT